MAISAGLVKELRERTGAGMMECKKALVESDGDIEAAIEAMRKAGQAKADKKATRVAAEGLIGLELNEHRTAGVMVEVNCETDFVAKEDQFKSFVTDIARQVLRDNPADLETLMASEFPGGEGTTVEAYRKELVARIGENISVRRFVRVESPAGTVGAYLHGGRIGVLVQLDAGDGALAKDIAMHVAASRPVCVSEADVPGELLAKEKEIFTAQAADSGKPPEIVEKMVAGRLRKFIAEVTLLGQPFVKNPDVTVEKHLGGAGGAVRAFQRFEVGEGIEKKADDFASEVMAQARRGGS